MGRVMNETRNFFLYGTAPPRGLDALDQLLQGHAAATPVESATATVAEPAEVAAKSEESRLDPLSAQARRLPLRCPSARSVPSETTLLVILPDILPNNFERLRASGKLLANVLTLSG